MSNAAATYTPMDWLSDLGKLLAGTRAKIDGEPTGMEDASNRLIGLFGELRDRGAKIWMVGNGGSAAICSHLAQDMMNKLGIAVMHFNDPSLITCMANDFGYESVFARPLEAMAGPGDGLIAISSSGESANIIACAKVARTKGLRLVTLSGFSPTNTLWETRSDVAFYLESRVYGLVETGHQAILHAVLESMMSAEGRG